MNELATVVDWSRLQFAMTAMFHWLFVPLTLGLSVIVAVMESIYVSKRTEAWKAATKFWMRLFGINFAIGVATGIILEFEFGTNWSNYSWFVGDIFGAPLAIEGLFAFFLESTFVAVMFFGWDKVSAKFHLTATWLTAIGASISALWILVANAWMQAPYGMEFDPAQMRNVMTDFWAIISPVAINKFFHAVFSGWTLAGVFVVGVSAWFLFRRSNPGFAIVSIKTGASIGLLGMILTMWTGDGSAVEVSRTQPMKLAAMEGLYDGEFGQSLVGVALLNTAKQPGDSLDAFHFSVDIPKGLSVLARHDMNAFVPGINDIIAGVDYDSDGKQVNTVSYAERIVRGKAAHESLRQYDIAMAAKDTAAMAEAKASLMADYPYFGYGYFDKPTDAVPPVALTFYSFRVMVILGGYFLVWLLFALWAAAKKPALLRNNRLVQWILILSVPLIWICSEAGWIVAEVGRQPWTIQDLLPVGAAISDISSSSVILSFWLFAGVFTALLAAEVSIMIQSIRKQTRETMPEFPESK
ncbi:MAG: cytochrome ubiquinol oxidase subunit I [Bacteroidales bacterium]|nr:cytochrome ubiquinol oxidase subunit I [Bacteroidales bacterium]